MDGRVYEIVSPGYTFGSKGTNKQHSSHMGQNISAGGGYKGCISHSQWGIHIESLQSSNQHANIDLQLYML